MPGRMDDLFGPSPNFDFEAAPSNSQGGSKDQLRPSSLPLHFYHPGLFQAVAF